MAHANRIKVSQTSLQTADKMYFIQILLLVAVGCKAFDTGDETKLDLLQKAIESIELLSNKTANPVKCVSVNDIKPTTNTDDSILDDLIKIPEKIRDFFVQIREYLKEQTLKLPWMKEYADKEQAEQADDKPSGE